MKEKIKKLAEDLREDLELLSEKIEDNEVPEYELKDLLNMLKGFKDEIWIYI